MEARHATAEVSGGQVANFQAADARMSDPIPGAHGLGLIARIRRVHPYVRLTSCVLLVCTGYYLGGVVGIALMFPDSPIAIIWPPNSILLATLLLTPAAYRSCGRFPQVGTAAHRRVCVLLASWLLLLATTFSPTMVALAATQAPTGSAQANPSLRQAATFTHITIEQGLSDQRVQAIIQDRTGFIWFGTNNGLNRYDGNSIVAYRHDPANPTSLSSNFIEVLYEDRSGTLWVGTWSGLNAFDRRAERFTRYLHDPADPRSLSHNRVRVIYEDRSGVL